MKKFSSKTVLLITMLVSLMPLLSGCIAIAAAGAGASAIYYVKGALNSHLTASLDESLPAVRKAMKVLCYTKTKETSDLESAKFIYRDEEDHKITITLQQKNRGLTEVSIRVGYIGDEEHAINILSQINLQL